MRIVNWNIQWMNDWFVGQGAVVFRHDNLNEGITDVDDLCKRVAGVITSLDPDILAVVEGPSDIREMELFVNTYLVDEHGDVLYYVFGGIDGRSQKAYTLVKKGGEYKKPPLIPPRL